MSHFVGLCFGDFWEGNLERYYEGLEVEEEITYTKEEAIEYAKKDHTYSYNTATEALKNREGLSENIIRFYNNIISKGETITDEEAWEEAQNWGYLIDDKGNLLSSYNPESKWDWYCVGGRWSNYLPMAEFDENDNIYYQDIATVGEVDWEQYKKEHNTPFCFVDLDGEWHECAHMGWWGMTSDDNENWENEFWEYVNSLPEDTVITTIDFHI